MDLTPEQYQQFIDSQALRGQTADADTKQYIQQMSYGEAEKGLAEVQLDVDKILENIENLLKGNKLINDPKRGRVWIEPVDNSKKILSDWGVQRMMEECRFHINVNTMLSNFKIEEINEIMSNFMKSLNDLFFLKGEVLYRETTFEEAKAIFEKNIEEKKKLRMFVKDFLGHEYTEEQVSKEIEKEMEDRIYNEIEKIKDEQFSLRQKESESILEQIEVQVRATYHRALGGEERGSLRRHTQFSDIRTSSPMPQQKQGGMFSWLSGR